MPRLTNRHHLPLGFIVILGFSVIAAIAQKPVLPRFDLVSVEQGLPARKIKAIAQDSFGFLWIGTSFGLSRFDGYSVKNYSFDPRDSSAIDDIYGLLADDQQGLWIGTGSSELKHLDLWTGHFTNFVLPLPENEAGTPRNLIIWSILKDSYGDLWIGTYGGGLFKMDLESQEMFRYHHIEGDAGSLSHNWVVQVYEDTQRNLWIGTEMGFNRYNREQDNFSRFYVNDWSRIEDNLNPNENSLGVFLEDKSGRLWVGSYGGGLYWFDRKNQQMKKQLQHDPNNPNSIASNLVEAIGQDRKGGLWLSTQNVGLNYLDFETWQFSFFNHVPSDPQSLSSNTINVNTIFTDKENNLWIGTNRGLNRLVKRFQPFHALTHDPTNRNSLSTNQVSGIYQDEEGIFWITTAGMGLNRYDSKSGIFTRFRHDPDDPASLANDHVKQVLADSRGNLWVGTLHGALNRLDRKTGKFQHYLPNPDDSTSLSHNWVNCLYEDTKGRLWIGTSGGLNRYDHHTGQFKAYYFHSSAYSDNQVLKITEDLHGNLWIICDNQGLTVFKPEKEIFINYKHDPQNANSISSNHLVDMLVDSRGQLWISSPNGLDLLTYRSVEMEDLTIQRKVLDVPVQCMLEQENGKLWLGTLQGLLEFDPEKGKVRQYDIADGLPSQVFNPNHAFRSKLTGELYFPTDGGVLFFHPDSLQDNPFVPAVVVSSIYYFDRDDENAVPVEVDPITYSKEVSLPYNQNTLLVEFAALSYNKTTKNQYAYRIKGSNENWINLGNERKITLTNLWPGNYQLEIIGSNGDGIWNEEGTDLKITIRPPWWQSNAAKGLYILLFLGVIYNLYRYQLQRKLQLSETRRLRELDEVKTRLYANITHEFRTPLTIILGMVDKVAASPGQWMHQGLSMIKRNGQNLLRLVNQMLDLSKLEAGKMQLNMIQGDVIPYLRYILESFESLAAMKNVKVHFHSQADSLTMDYDPENLLNIISNLLSNAVKFTEAGGEVHLSVDSNRHESHYKTENQDQQAETTPSSITFNQASRSRTTMLPLGEMAKAEGGSLLIRITDTGPGILQSQLPHIFDRYYQADTSTTRKGEGTGIGLALTKELVKLMRGEIQVTSKIGEGTTFTVLLPITREATAANALEQASIREEISGLTDTHSNGNEETKLLTNTDSEKPLLLIAEDNKDVVAYLVACLEGNYQLEIAYDGRQGIERAQELVPDLIISDVMMPGKDGFELCYTLKNDMRTSHIPIVLLTAKADIHSKVAGLRRGADAYLAKPFNEQELQVRLQQLLALRRKLQQQYSTTPYLSDAAPVPEKSETPLEDEFLLKIRQVMTEHLDNYDFDVSQLCREMGMSRTAVHNKLKALTGKSTTEFMRHIRLQKARELLRSRPELNISEVAYETGFRNPTYFTKMFGKLFGVSPTEYREAEIHGL